MCLISSLTRVIFAIGFGVSFGTFTVEVSTFLFQANLTTNAKSANRRVATDLIGIIYTVRFPITTELF